jgi:hypothetical protein
MFGKPAFGLAVTPLVGSLLLGLFISFMALLPPRSEARCPQTHLVVVRATRRVNPPRKCDSYSYLPSLSGLGSF